LANFTFFELAAAVPNLFVIITSGPRCEHVRSKLSGNFLFARDSPAQNQRQRYRIAISEMGRQVRMLLRKKVRYHVRAAGKVYIWGATVAGKVN
jgi:hypothetical protein